MTRSSSSTLFVQSLISEAAHKDIPAEHRIFAPFIGDWDLVVSWFDEAGKLSRQERGEWHFSWILEGRAIQDIWIVPPRAERVVHRDLYEYGTSLRFFDAKLKAWQSTWIGPMHGVVRTFTARQIDDRIVLETIEGALPRMRWSFGDIEKDSFTWRNELWTASGWLTQQAFAARRSAQDQ